MRLKDMRQSVMNSLLLTRDGEAIKVSHDAGIGYTTVAAVTWNPKAFGGWDIAWETICTPDGVTSYVY